MGTAAGGAVAASTVFALDGVRMPYAWGSTDLIPALRGEPPTGTPEAEVWFGGHEAHPSDVVFDDGSRVALTFANGFEPPTFLVKLLAAGAPLSLQVHPDRETAIAGFAAEDAQGVARDAPERRYRDASDKPEMLRALTPVRLLCGFRRTASTRRLLAVLVPEGLNDLAAILAQGDAGLSRAVDAILRAPLSVTAARLAAVAAGLEAFAAQGATSASVGAAGRVDVEQQAELALVADIMRDLLRRYPTDPGVLLALLLRPMTLEPGEAIYVGPGVLHAYLSGLGVEVMATSDNVLRGGLTEKYVDVAEFLRVLDARVGEDPRVGALRGATPREWSRLVAPTSAFLLDEAQLDGTLRLERSGSGPSVVLCTRGDVVVSAADKSSVRLGPGRAAYIATGDTPVQVAGVGEVFHVRAGSALPGERDGRA